MISINSLTKRFGDHVAVDNLSFDVKPGEVLGYLGPNGAGKSTTMKMLTGFLTPDGGSASVCGFDIQTQTLLAQQKMGYLPEGAPCYGDMRVKGFLEFIANVRGLSGAERQRQVQRAVEQVELQDVLGQRIETLSKGFKRRVGLAQAILHDPQVLILDEPTDGLDPNQKHQVRRLIQQLAEGSNKIVVISTHILEEVSAVCSRAVIIGKYVLQVCSGASIRFKMIMRHDRQAPDNRIGIPVPLRIDDDRPFDPFTIDLDFVEHHAGCAVYAPSVSRFEK